MPEPKKESSSNALNDELSNMPSYRAYPNMNNKYVNTTTMITMIREWMKIPHTDLITFNAWDRKIDKKGKDKSGKGKSNQVYRMAMNDAQRVSALDGLKTKKETVKSKSEVVYEFRTC